MNAPCEASEFQTKTNDKTVNVMFKAKNIFLCAGLVLAASLGVAHAEQRPKTSGLAKLGDPERPVHSQHIGCGFPSQCVIALPKGVMLVDDFVASSPMMDVSVREAGNSEYVIVSLREDPEFKTGGMLALFTDEGAYLFAVSAEISEDDMFVGLQ
jgi:hypothetical protein